MTYPGSQLIVAMVLTKTLQPKRRSRKDKGLSAAGPLMSPPFKNPFHVVRGDEKDPEPHAMQAIMPYEMERLAWDYYMWTVDGRKKEAPLFAAVVDELCKARLCLCMGFGSTIYFENIEDAQAMLEYFS